MSNKLESIIKNIQAQLESGTLPSGWEKPFTKLLGAKDYSSLHNPVTGTVYSKFNQASLFFQAMIAGKDITSWPIFLTYKQAQDLGGQVIKGAKSYTVAFAGYVPYEAENEKGEKENKFRYHHKEFAVFHISDIAIPAETVQALYKNYEAPVYTKPSARWEFVTINHHSQAEAYYMPSADSVFMPYLEAFSSAEAYTCTLVHELAHATAHETRLNRSLSGRFGSKAYATEELIAEVTAMAFCENELGLSCQDNSLAYLNSWSKVFDNKAGLVINLFSHIDKAYNFLLENMLD